MSIFDVSDQRDRELYQPFPCITCGLAICGAAGMAVLRALWSELEDFEANHLNSDCFLKEEPSLYWKVWPIGH